MSVRVVLALCAASWGLAAQDQAPKLPAPYHTPSAANAPSIIKRPDGAQLAVPQGFMVDEFASGFEKPRYMALGPSGEVLISDSVKKGGVYVLHDANRNGRIDADEKRKITGDIDRPFGLALWKNYLYVAEPTAVKRYKYDAKSMTAGEPESVVAIPGDGKGHWTRTILFDRKGEKFYMGIGSRSNVSAGEDELSATMNRYNPDGSGHEIVATGLRNTIGMAWYPGTDTLWGAVQERDGLGDDLVPDYFTAIKPGAFYGWPYAYIGPNEEPRNKGLRPDLVAKTVVPDAVLQSHVAVMDARFYTGKSFPSRYRNGAFLAYRGSSNRAERVGYSVVFLPFRNGKPSGPLENFLTGFMADPKSKDVWGRPVGLLELADGSLLVSEDGGNKVYRVSYRK